MLFLTAVAPAAHVVAPLYGGSNQSTIQLTLRTPQLARHQL